MTFHALKSCSEEAKILLGVIWKAFKVSQLHFSPRLLGCEHLASVLCPIWNPQGPACSTDDQWWTESSPGFLFWENQTRLGLFSGEIIKKSTISGSTIIKETWNCSMEASALHSMSGSILMDLPQPQSFGRFVTSHQLFFYFHIHILMDTLYPGALLMLFYSCAKIPQFLRINNIFKPTSTSFFFPPTNLPIFKGAILTLT